MYKSDRYFNYNHVAFRLVTLVNIDLLTAFEGLLQVGMRFPLPIQNLPKMLAIKKQWPAVTGGIMLTCLCNFYPLTPHFYIVQPGFIVVYVFVCVLLCCFFCSKTLIVGTH